MTQETAVEISDEVVEVAAKATIKHLKLRWEDIFDVDEAFCIAELVTNKHGNQEPVAVVRIDTQEPDEIRVAFSMNDWKKLNTLPDGTKLYASPQPAQPSVPVSKVTMPVRLPPLAVSEIKDMLAREYGLFDFKARPLWAQMVKILAGISIEEQEKLIASHDGRGNGNG